MFFGDDTFYMKEIEVFRRYETKLTLLEAVKELGAMPLTKDTAAFWHRWLHGATETYREIVRELVEEGNLDVSLDRRGRLVASLPPRVSDLLSRTSEWVFREDLPEGSLSFAEIDGRAVMTIGGNRIQEVECRHNAQF